ncbi:MAG: ATP-grasp domain-containing protein [Pirellulaceae bacterium]
MDNGFKSRCGSGGGQRILRSNPNDKTTLSDAYFQQWVDGTSCSGVFAVQPRQACFLGATEQLVGTKWGGPEPFSYCGSVGPIQQTESNVQQWQQIGHTLASHVTHVGRVGIIGVDAIWQNGKIWPVEVNPRYVASVEVLERSWGESIFQRGLCLANKADASTRDAQRIFGKLIVYANRDGILGEDFFRSVQDSNRGKSVVFADIPNDAAVIRHAPILTVLAEGISRAEVLAGLRIRQQFVYSSIR